MTKICYCTFILLYSSLHFSLSEIYPPITINLTITFLHADVLMSYHMLNWTIEDQTNVPHFILRVLNLILIDTQYSWNVSIHGNMNSYFFQKNKRDLLSLSIVSLDKCNRISGMSNNVSLPSTFACK